MKKIISGLIALVLAAVPALSANVTLSAPAEQGGFRATLVSFSTGRLLCEDETDLTVLRKKYGQVVRGAQAAGISLSIKLYQIEQDCTSYAVAVAKSNSDRISALEARVSNVEKCCAKKGKKVVRRHHYKKGGKKAVYRRHRTRRPVRRVKNNWCKTHRLYQVTRPHLWYSHGCGVESGGGGGEIRHPGQKAPGGHNNTPGSSAPGGHNTTPGPSAPAPSPAVPTAPGGHNTTPGQ